MKQDFDNMCLIKKIYWKIKLFWMDHDIFDCERSWRILEPSYYYTHTEEECRQEKQRIIEEIYRIIEEP